MTNVNKQSVDKQVEKKVVQKVPLRGRFDIVVRQLQGEYSTANGWAIIANNLVANQLTVVVERVAPKDVPVELAILETTVASVDTTEAPKTPVKRTTKTTTKKTED